MQVEWAFNHIHFYVRWAKCRHCATRRLRNRWWDWSRHPSFSLLLPSLPTQTGFIEIVRLRRS